MLEVLPTKCSNRSLTDLLTRTRVFAWKKVFEKGETRNHILRASFINKISDFQAQYLSVTNGRRIMGLTSTNFTLKMELV